MKGRNLTAIFAAFAALLLGPAWTEAATSPVPKHQSVQAHAAAGAYVVRRGDTLTSIARNFHTTPGALMSENKLSGSRIKVGQQLRVPAGALAKAAKTQGVGNEQVKPPALPEQKAEGAEDPPARIRLAQAGFQMLGVRYRRSGGSEKSGFDCSGLVKRLYSMFDIELPRTSREQFLQGEKVDRDKLEIGDLVFFSSGGDRPTHVGVYVGNDKFLHAALKARQVIISDLNKIWYTMRYVGARRISALWGDETPQGPQPEATE